MRIAVGIAGAALALMASADSALSLSLSAGLLIGIGLSGTSFSVILGVVGRAVPVEKRSMGMGIASAAGSFGQFGHRHFLKTARVFQHQLRHGLFSTRELFQLFLNSIQKGHSSTQGKHPEVIKLHCTSESHHAP